MVRYTGPKNRIARRFKANIFGKARNPLLHKPNPPGAKGTRRRKQSDYGLQLLEKQKLKAIYGMLREKQLLKYYREAMHLKGNTSHHFLSMLECRLDNVVYKLKFANSIFAAHQLVAHGHILVDGKRVDRRSFQVKPGMVISIREKSRKMKSINESIEGAAREIPEFLEFDKNNFSGKLLVIPKPKQITLPIVVNIPVVCEFLAHTS